MSFWVAGAVVVSAAGAAYSSHKSSKDQKESIQKGLDQSKDISQQARSDVLSLFDRSAESSRIGSQAAFDFYKKAAPHRMTPYMQGSQSAQNVIGLGAEQANNAILGQPVDMSFTQQPQIEPNTDYLLGAEMPDYESSDVFDDGTMGPAEPAEEGKAELSTEDKLHKYNAFQKKKEFSDRKFKDFKKIQDKKLDKLKSIF